MEADDIYQSVTGETDDRSLEIDVAKYFKQIFAVKVCFKLNMYI